MKTRMRIDAGKLGWLPALASFAVTCVVAIDYSNRLQVDIAVYLMGGAHVFARDLYTVGLPGIGLPFTYPPFSALLFAPLAHLPGGFVDRLWACINVGALTVLLHSTIRALRPELGRRTTIQWALIASAPAAYLDPVRSTLGFGQVNLILAAIILFDLTSRLRIGSRTLPRGVLTGLAAAIKLTPLIFIPFLFFSGLRREARNAVAGFVASTLITFAIAPHASWTFWTDDVFKSRAGNAWYIADQNLKALMERIHHGAVSESLIALVSVVVALVGLAIAVAAYRRSSPFLGILCCATVGLMVSPISWSHHYVWVVPVMGWLLLGRDRPRAGWLWAAATGVLFWVHPIWDVPHEDNRELHETAWQLVQANSYFFGACCLLIGTAVLLWKRASRSSIETTEHDPLDRGTPEVTGALLSGQGDRRSSP